MSFATNEKGRSNMNVVWIGFHEEGLPAFKAVLQSDVTISGFITLDDQAFEKRSAGSREYIILSEENDIPIYYVSTIKGEQAFQIISELKPDLMIVLGWSEILPERLLNIPTIGTVGTHAALLPHNRGSAPINWALINGENQTGNTLMWLSSEVDAGEIIDQISFPITPYDTCKTLYEKVAQTNAVMLTRLINSLNNGVTPSSQIKNIISEPILPRRKPKDGLLSFHQSAEHIYNFVRALTDPYPGAFSFLCGEKWFIWKAAILPVSSKILGLEPGEIYEKKAIGFDQNSALLVGTETNVILLFEIEDSCGIRYSGDKIGELKISGRFD